MANRRFGVGDALPEFNVCELALALPPALCLPSFNPIVVALNDILCITFEQGSVMLHVVCDIVEQRFKKRAELHFATGGCCTRACFVQQALLGPGNEPQGP